jgi:hypothetical protein
VYVYSFNHEHYSCGTYYVVLVNSDVWAHVYVYNFFTMLGEPLGIIKKIFYVSMVGGPK